MEFENLPTDYSIVIHSEDVDLAISKTKNEVIVENTSLRVKFVLSKLRISCVVPDMTLILFDDSNRIQIRCKTENQSEIINYINLLKKEE